MVGDDVGRAPRPGRTAVGVERGGAAAAQSAVQLARPAPATPRDARCRAGRAVGQRGQRQPGVGDDAGGAEPVGVVRVDVDAREPHRGVGEQRVGARWRSRSAATRRSAPGRPRGPGRWRPGCPPGRCRRPATRPAAARRPCRRRSRRPGCRSRPARRLELGGGAGVDDAAAGDDQRLLGGGQQRQRPRRPRPGRAAGGGSSSPARRRTRPGSRRRGTGCPAAATITTAPASAGSVSTRMAAGSAVSSCSGRVMRSKKRQTGRNASLTVTSASTRVLQLLQHRALVPGRVGVAGQQQHGQPVDGGQRGAGDHVHRARADRGGHGQGGVPPAVLGERGGRVHQGLLVAALDERHRVAELVQGLAEAGHVAVPEDAQGGGDQRGGAGRRRPSTAGTGRSRRPGRRSTGWWKWSSGVPRTRNRLGAGRGVPTLPRVAATVLEREGREPGPRRDPPGVTRGGRAG